jgi:ABC-type phosphate transport system permease subunit
LIVFIAPLVTQLGLLAGATMTAFIASLIAIPVGLIIAHWIEQPNA